HGQYFTRVPCPIKGSIKCHSNSIPAALSKLSCSAGWRCFSYSRPSYPPEQPSPRMCPLWIISGHVQRSTQCLLRAKSGLMQRSKNDLVDICTDIVTPVVVMSAYPKQTSPNRTSLPEPSRR